MTGAYVTRLELAHSPALPAPHIAAGNLFELARELLLKSRAQHA